MVWIWVGIGAICGLIELFTVTFFGLWMAIAAFVPAVVVLIAPGISYSGQIGIWCVSILCCAFAWVKWSRNKPEPYVEEPLIGQVGNLAVELPIDGQSVILLTKPVQGKQQWPCKAEVALSRDARVQIVGFADGFVLVAAVVAELV